jgi:hypothetical protein
MLNSQKCWNDSALKSIAVMSEYSPIEGLFRRSIVERVYWIVLRRPSEPARLTAKVRTGPKLSGNRQTGHYSKDRGGE